MVKTRRLSYAQELRLVRQIIEFDATYEEAGAMFGFTNRQFAYSKVCEIKKKFPEFIDHMKAVRQYEDCPIEDETIEPDPEINPNASPIPAVYKEQMDNLPKTKQTTTQAISTEINPTQQIINNIETTLQTITKLHPEEIMAMKTKDRLKLIEPLVKTLRLMQGESTQNIKKLSLIKAVGIATARRKPSG